jgi:hypothetical protein
MGTDTGEAHGAARLMYPDLPEPLTPADLHRLFTPAGKLGVEWAHVQPPRTARPRHQAKRPPQTSGQPVGR